jgi:Asp-tRNA(Asn)/Glu-tRNA(Gln) amidotransferase A subunit family amidase
MKQARAAWLALRTEMESHGHDNTDASRRTFQDLQAHHAHHQAHREAFEFRRDVRQRTQGRRDLAQLRKDEARRLGEELKREIKGEARQRSQEIKDAVKRGKRPGRQKPL